MQLVLILTPLITYPHLIRVLGKDIYGNVILAQIVVSYFSIFIDFGFKKISAKAISENSENKIKLSVIMSSILTLRFAAWLIGFVFYLILILLVETYNTYFWLYLFSYGFTFNELLTSQFYFQGIEKMKFMTLINFISRVFIIVGVYSLIKTEADYLYVPIIYSISFFISGLYSLYIIFYNHKISLIIPRYSELKSRIKDSSPIFFSNVLTAIKDKTGFIVIGQSIGTSELAVYDLAYKLMNLLTKPIGVLSTVMLPRIAKEKNIKLFFRTLKMSVIGTALLWILMNYFLPEIVYFFLDTYSFIHEIRLFLISAIILSISSIISFNLFIPFGLNIYLFRSILITVSVYVLVLVFLFFFNLVSLDSIILLTLCSFLLELLYRLYIARKFLKNIDSNPKIN